MIKNDYNDALSVCEEAIEKLKNKPTVPKNVIYLFYSRMLTCYIQLKKFKKGEIAFQNALGYTETAKYNWFILNKNYVLLCFKSKDYQKAYDIYLSVIKYKQFNKLAKNIQELWKINEAYIYFFHLIGLIKKSSDEGRRRFRINKFLNDVPIFSMDKKGINIPILIIQLLFLLHQKKYGVVIDKVEALNVYCYRHLKKDDTFRSNCFIKMLLLLSKCNFHKVGVERKSKSLLKKLNSVPSEQVRQSAEIEIVPYEDLWEIVLNMLDNNFHIARNKK